MTCRLYLITPPTLDAAKFRDPLARALDGGDVACLQLRLKDADDDAIRAAADILQPVTQEHDVAFIINDRPDLARDVSADGVHVGQQDASYDEARTMLADGAIVGVTCHNSRHLAMEAADKGADYVAFGAFFPTTTKEAKHHADIETLTAWTDATTVPSVAIGGITVENAPPLVRAGADFLAVVSAVWNHPDGPGAAVKAFNDMIAVASSEAS
ncbi:MAG: thiamine phosphate synthase [Rhodospirillaceae bacterium]|jgi:thiamine-phosphate pyrophosphorylase|nr:thiamine phosphate synthase [Rhodospirillales bacterium]MBT3905241.1 thiamine phosphate synthase [Rhodospirillaceae bacterium]MBT4703473.1 thiamine phosphate synthase [Rhodospirillaceae bacterium]MBT5033371.1 thiamine phosphate synthase [Rhodospirillaceae bacterium]MBT6219215.1 thiamine phosphate synthase [Rhodospirillaceae bacterium]